VARNMAELTVKVRCERIVPVRGAVADLFKKTSIVVTRVIEVNCYYMAVIVDLCCNIVVIAVPAHTRTQKPG